MDLCRYIKSKDGWYQVETGHIIPYGETVLEFYLFFDKMIDDFDEAKDKLYDEISDKCKDTLFCFTPEYKELEKKYHFLTENYNAIHRMHSVIGFYLEENNLKVASKKWNCDEDSFYSSKDQEIAQKHRIDLAKECGWIDISDDEDIPSIDIFLLREAKYLEPKTTTCYINHQWYAAFVFGNDFLSSYQMAIMDLQELRNHDDIDFAICKNCTNQNHYCNKLFIKRGKRLYCEDCRPNYKKNYDEKIKNSVFGKHDKIRQLMKNSGRFSDEERYAFLDESKFYKDTVKGKNPENSNNYREDIRTLQDYSDWLDQKHEEYKVHR